MENTPDVVVTGVRNSGPFDFSRLHVGKAVVQIAIFSLISFSFAYDIPQLKPLKVAAVYFHEVGHAVSAWATQGKVLDLKISYGDEGGITKSEGGYSLIITMSGYLFQGLVGALALTSSYRQRWGALFCAGAGFLALGSCAAFLGGVLDRPTIQCAILIVIGCLGTGFLSLSRFFWHTASFVIRICGSYWCIYTIFDVFHDCVTSHNHTSDADVIARQIGIGGGIIGLVWLIFIGTMTGIAAYWSALPEPAPQPILRRARVSVRPNL